MDSTSTTEKTRLADPPSDPPIDNGPSGKTPSLSYQEESPTKSSQTTCTNPNTDPSRSLSPTQTDTKEDTKIIILTEDFHISNTSYVFTNMITDNEASEVSSRISEAMN